VSYYTATICVCYGASALRSQGPDDYEMRGTVSLEESTGPYMCVSGISHILLYECVLV